MINNLADYFLPEQEYYLENVSYTRIESDSTVNGHLLNCIDQLEVSVNEEHVKLKITRSLVFEPNELFELNVSFGAILKFNQKVKNEYNWNEMNLAEEFKENGDFVTVNLMTRISLLVSQITSSFGQIPIILPPQLASKTED